MVTFSPPSSTPLAVRSTSEPVQLPGAIAGQLTRSDAVPLLTMIVSPLIVTGWVESSAGGAVGGGVSFGVRSTASKPSRTSSCPLSATTESLPSPPRARSAVLSRTST